jgi:hypothetical protein
MDGGNRAVKEEQYRPGMVHMNLIVPAELKYLVIHYKNTTKMPSFNYAVRQLLETHPVLARLAAELVQSSIGDGLDTSTSESTSSELRHSSVAGLFHGHLHCGQVPDSRGYYAFR